MYLRLPSVGDFPTGSFRLRRTRVRGALAIIAFFVCLSSPPPLRRAAEEFDVVIRNGRVVDGTGNPWFHGAVAVKEDRIVQVGSVNGRGKREIDARGLVVAPGFIDIHSHSDWT